MKKKRQYPLAVLLALIAQIAFNIPIGLASEDDPADVLEPLVKEAFPTKPVSKKITAESTEVNNTAVNNTALERKVVESTEAVPNAFNTPTDSAPATDSNAEQVKNQANGTPLAIDAVAEPTLELLGSTIEPGEASLLKWAFEATFVDTSAPVPVLVVNGAKPGPTLCLTAAVHGDELNGIEVVRRVVHEIDPETLSGAVIGVPIVNLQGFLRASRYLPDRRDLNRYFPGRIKGSYASRIAHSFFTNIVEQCDYLIDIHTGSLSRTNLPQIRANLMFSEVASLAQKMGSIVVLQSKGAVGTLRRAATEAGIPAVTLEAGAPNNLQKDAVEQGVKSVLTAMGALGLTAKKSFWKRSEEPIYYQSTWIRASQGGILFSKIELGDKVKKGNILGLLSDPITNKTTEIIAPIEGRVIGMALNQVMYPGFAAYHIGLKSSAVEAAQPAQLIPDEATEDTSATTPENGELTQTDTTTKEGQEITEPSSKNAIEDMELPTMDKK